MSTKAGSHTLPITPLALRENAERYVAAFGNPYLQSSTLANADVINSRALYLFRVSVEPASVERQAPLASDPVGPRTASEDPLTEPGRSRESRAQLEWLSGLREKLQSLLELRSDWNREGAPRISPEAARGAFELAFITRPAVPPSVIPTQSGGVQFEWHRGEIDLEVELLPEGGLNLWYDDEESRIERQEHLRSLRAASQEVGALLAIVEARAS